MMMDQVKVNPIRNMGKSEVLLHHWSGVSGVFAVSSQIRNWRLIKFVVSRGWQSISRWRLSWWTPSQVGRPHPVPDTPQIHFVIPGSCTVFGESSDFPQQMVLIYDGIHYDALYDVIAGKEVTLHSANDKRFWFNPHNDNKGIVFFQHINQGARYCQSR